MPDVTMRMRLSAWKEARRLWKSDVKESVWKRELRWDCVHRACKWQGRAGQGGRCAERAVAMHVLWETLLTHGKLHKCIGTPLTHRRVLDAGSGGGGSHFGTAAKLQTGLSEAQNGYGFGMLTGHGHPDGQFSSLVLNDSPGCKLSTTPEHENCPSGRPCLMGRGVNPTFHSQMSTSDQTLHQIT